MAGQEDKDRDRFMKPVLQPEKDSQSKALQESGLSKALLAVSELDGRNAWADLASKDVPADIACYVADRLTEESVDHVRREMGMPSPADPRWRKIMQSIRTGKRIDATGMFIKWLERNERIGDQVYLIADDIMKGNRPYSKLLMEALALMSNLQMNTVKMGKELGVFADTPSGGGAGQGVTIVVQTNVPSPTQNEIVIHQEKRAQRNQDLLEKNKPGKS